MIPLLTGVLVASWFGSLHCAGMCGGIVAFATAPAHSLPDNSRSPESPVRRRLPVLTRDAGRAHLAYQSGRLLGYAALGVAAGSFGSVVNLAGSLTGWSDAAAFGAALVMLAWAVALLVRGWLWRAVRDLRLLAPLEQIFVRALGRAAALPRDLRAFSLGSATGLLPCGWLYGFVVVAAGTGSALRGGLVMSSFWLGSVPALLGVGSAAQLLGAGFRRRLPTLGALTLLILGCSTLWWRYQASARVLDARAPVSSDGAPIDPAHDRLSCGHF